MKFDRCLKKNKMKPGDYVIYSDDVAFARISDIKNDEIVISNYLERYYVCIPMNRINYLLPCRFVPKEVDTWFNSGTDFARERLNKEDVEYLLRAVKDAASTVIQKWIVNVLYRPPNGRMYQKTLDSFTMMAKQLYD